MRGLAAATVTYALGEPNPRQKQFFLSRARFTAYGGARGGGKSWAVRKKALLLCLRYAGIRVLLLRRSYPELRENHILPLQAELRLFADYSETQKAFAFYNGSRLVLGHCNNQSDIGRYQGQEYDVIFIDEATHFTELQFKILSASLRGANTFPKRMYLTCNPGGVGHGWVKRLFIERDFGAGERAEDYVFIPAKATDNHALLRDGGSYIQMLEALPENLRRAWLNGDWDVLAGRYFPEFSKATHVVAPFEIPRCWAKYFAMDYGLDMLAGYWVALAPNGDAVVYREIYQSGLIISDAAKAISGRCREFVDWFVAPPDLWNRRQDTGKSAAEIFEQNGIPLVKANNSRVQGWYALKEWLRVREGARPKLTVFPECRALIRSLESVLYDEADPNDMAKTPHELTHAPDALRYFAAFRPAPRAKAPPAPDAQLSQIASFLDYGR